MQCVFDMEVIVTRRNGSGGIGAWSDASDRGPLWVLCSRSRRTPRLWREQLSPQLIKVGQREHGLRPRQILGQATVSHLGEAPQLLEHPKRMLATGAGP